MRLWHQDLLDKLPRQQLLGQHRECCALRGKGWGKSHSTVNYVFKHDMERLVAYHILVMQEMQNRGYNPNTKWADYNYRGKKLQNDDKIDCLIVRKYLKLGSNIYPEHNNGYLQECIDNLVGKGVTCQFIEGVA